MVCHNLQFSAIVPYTCSILCVVAIGVITPRGRHIRAKKLFIEKNIFMCKRKIKCNVWCVWLLTQSQDSWLQESGFRKRAINHSLATRQLIPLYIGSKINLYSEGTSPCTFKRSRVSVHRKINCKYFCNWCAMCTWSNLWMVFIMMDGQRIYILIGI